jgi:hypothetical protein
MSTSTTTITQDTALGNITRNYRNAQRDAQWALKALIAEAERQLADVEAGGSSDADLAKYAGRADRALGARRVAIETHEALVFAGLVEAHAPNADLAAKVV